MCGLMFNGANLWKLFQNYVTAIKKLHIVALAQFSCDKLGYVYYSYSELSV